MRHQLHLTLRSRTKSQFLFYKQYAVMCCDLQLLSTPRINGRKLVLKSSLMCWRCMLHNLYSWAVRVNRSHEYVACVRVLLFLWGPWWGGAQVLLEYQDAERRDTRKDSDDTPEVFAVTGDSCWDGRWLLASLTSYSIVWAEALQEQTAQRPCKVSCRAEWARAARLLFRCC